MIVFCVSDGSNVHAWLCGGGKETYGCSFLRFVSLIMSRFEEFGVFAARCTRLVGDETRPAIRKAERTCVKEFDLASKMDANFIRR